MFDSLNPSELIVRYVGDILREKDRDMYICSLFSPPRVRSAIMALYAFNAEVTATFSVFDEPTVGYVRLKWWYDALEGVFKGTPAHHPVLTLLEKVVPLGINRQVLESLIEAELLKLGDERVLYSSTRWVPLFVHVLDLLGSRSDETERAAENAAKAWGELSKLRNSAKGSSDIRTDYNIVSNYRAKASGIKGDAVPALLPMVLADIYLERIKRVGYNSKHQLVQRSDPGVLVFFRLWWAVNFCGV